MSPLLTPSSERVWSFFRQFILTKAFWNRAIICKLKKKKKKGPAVMQAIFCLGKCGRAGRANPLGARGGNVLGQRKHPASAGRKRRWAPRGASAVPPKRSPRHFTFRREDYIILLCVARLCLSMERAFFLFLCNTPFPLPFASCAPCPPSP